MLVQQARALENEFLAIELQLNKNKNLNGRDLFKLMDKHNTLAMETDVLYGAYLQLKSEGN